MASEKVLIAGGAGFIGQHLCRRLLDLNYHVISVDNYSSGREENTKQFDKDIFYENIYADITDFKEYKDVKYIFNLACQASPKFYNKEPVETLLTSIQGSDNLLKIASVIDARVLFTSSSEIYGKSNSFFSDQIESHNGSVNPFCLRSCYSEGKRSAESLHYAYREKYGVSIRIARLFNCYGPKMRIDDGRVISSFIVNALKNKPLYIHGDGEQTRSFCYIDDTVDALIKLMFESSFDNPINIGNPQEISIEDLAKIILKITNSKSKLVYIKNRDREDPEFRKPNIGLAQMELNWTPKISLIDGLNKTIEYFDCILSKRNANINFILTS